MVPQMVPYIIARIKHTPLVAVLPVGVPEGKEIAYAGPRVSFPPARHTVIGGRE